MPPSQEHQSDLPEIPEYEMIFTSSRASGKGGQNVNKVESKVDLRWHPESSKAPFTEEQRARILERIPGAYRTDEGFIHVVCQETRSQPENKKRAIEILRQLVAEALAEEVERVPTKPTRGSQERRKDEKKNRGRLKQERGRKDWD